jgi:hypothetical protein
VRTFWTSMSTAFISFEMRDAARDTLNEIRLTALDHLTVFLADRAIAEEAPVLYAVETTDDEPAGAVRRGWLHCYVRKGRYRVRVYGLPEWMQHEWDREGAASQLSTNDGDSVGGAQ